MQRAALTQRARVHVWASGVDAGHGLGCWCRVQRVSRLKKENTLRLALGAREGDGDKRNPLTRV
jgi:hypothetical protein